MSVCVCCLKKVGNLAGVKIISLVIFFLTSSESFDYEETNSTHKLIYACKYKNNTNILCMHI